jgi:hypothetical protein
MSDVTRSVKEGAGFGLAAGAVFAMAQGAASLMTGVSPLLPFRRVASLVFGTAALENMSPSTLVVVGLICHLYVSAIYGLLYAIYNSALTEATRSSIRRQMLLGLLYGTVLWIANNYVFVPFHYPWLLGGGSALQFVLHALAYGLPLGLLYGISKHHAATAHAPGGPEAAAHLASDLVPERQHRSPRS